MASKTFDISKYSKLGTEQLLKAVTKLIRAAGQDPEVLNLDSYDRAGLIDLAKHWGAKAKAEDAEVSADGDVAVEVPVKVTRHRKAKFAPDTLVLMGDDATPASVISSEWDVEVKEWLYVLGREDERVSDVLESDLTKARKPKAEKPPKAPRVRMIADDVVLALRLKRRDENLSYAKLATWLRETHDISVTGDLVRSIVIGEIYKHVEMPEPLPVVDVVVEVPPVADVSE